MSERVAVVGGHGQVARLLAVDLVKRGSTPVALVRREEYRAELEALGAEVRILDIENSRVEEFSAAFRGCDAVVFAAGGGPDGNLERKRTVDLEGSLKSIAAAEQGGIRRFVQVSAIGVDEPLPADTAPVWRAYVEAKRDADLALRASTLDWTVIRPGRLTDDPATGLVRLGGDDLSRGDVTRADVAAVVAESLAAPTMIGVQVVLIGGPDPIAEAVAACRAGSL
jgi:uncharacterized protein YbjT (DUF2867 family)